MNTDKKNRKKRPQRIRTGSIARRINSAQAWRRFSRSFFMTLLVTALVFVSWCLLIEWAYGGEITNVSNRHFGGSFNWQENIIDLTNRNGISMELKKYIRENDPLDFRLNTPFDGIEYRFTVIQTEEGYTLTEVDSVAVETTLPETEPVAVYPGYTEIYPGGIEPAEPVMTDPLESAPVVTEPTETVIHRTDPIVTEDTGNAENVRIAGETEAGVDYISQKTLLTRQQINVTHDAGGMLTVCTLFFSVCFLFQLASLLSCLLSGSRIIKKYLKPIDELALVADRLSAEMRSMTTEQAREESLDLDSLENAINAIEDSDTRLQVHDAELGSLEAALNNMLKRLDEGKRKQIRFVDDASHELRTPIAVIQGYIQLLDRWGKEDEKVRDEAIEAIKTEVEHMKTLVDQLLFLARGEMDRHVLDKAPLNISEVLAEIRDESIMLEENAEVRHEFTLSLPMKEGAEEDDEFPYEDLYIRADHAMMKQAIRILRDNAVKYTPDRGKISFKAYHRTTAATNGVGKDSICIEISDTGIGIKPKELPRIFDRFYRGENVRANNSSGSGLGLSIAKWIVDEHGGIMEAISSEGVGTKMTIVMDEENVSRETN